MEPANQDFKLNEGELTTVLGGSNGTTLKNTMTCQVGFLPNNTTLSRTQPFIALITEGHGTINNIPVSKGDLTEGVELNLCTSSKIGLVLITESQAHLAPWI
jgi:hypothetical protein